jgi:Flp pilus assembly protein TadG
VHGLHSIDFPPEGVSAVTRLQPSIPQQGLLVRLRRDKRGNTLAMITMALIPLIAMSGSAVDIGRSYLVKTRLQQACDAGVLAGRRAMAGATYGTAEQAQASTFFNTNMSQTFAGATNVVFNTSGGANNEVLGTASARVPTTLMKLFYQEGIDVNVNCSARLDVSNTDVMMVLDVTGSMDECPDGTNSCNGSLTTNKISILRAAVINFYDTIRAATPPNVRFRIGFVPYSANVNLGIDPRNNQPLLTAGWTVDNWTYQTREANMNVPVVRTYVSRGSATTAVDTSSYPILSSANCTAWGLAAEASPSGLPVIASGTLPNVVGRTYINNTSADWGWAGAADTSGTDRSCRRRYEQRNYTGATRAYAFREWRYGPVTFNVAQYRAGNAINVYTSASKPAGSVPVSNWYNMISLVAAPLTNTAGNGTISGTATTFAGCMEERDTVAQATFSNIPAGALDMNHTTTPTNDASRWRPVWPELVYDRSSVAVETTSVDRAPEGAACPRPASKLWDRPRADVVTYVTNLQPTGATFHSLGMAWGLRMVSANGIWGAENTTAPNGQPISRHIIFMTDGAMNADPERYSSHGFEKLDRRAFGSSGTPDSNAMNSRHNSRFIAMCNAARQDPNNPITVWTVAFGTANTPQLQACADPGRSFEASNAAQLQAQFQAIASQIAQLRLSQ